MTIALRCEKLHDKLDEIAKNLKDSSQILERETKEKKDDLV